MATRLLSLAAAALSATALLAAPPPRMQDPRWWAVVVGIDEYQSKDMRRLVGAVADARAIKAALERNVGIPPANITLLVSDGAIKPTKKDILQSLSDLQSKAEDEDRLFFFFAGHGVEIDKTRYLLTHEANPGSVADIESTGLAASQLMQKIEQITLRDRVVMIDACREDPSPMLREVPYRAVQSLETSYMITPTSAGVRATYLSASSGEFAWEWKEQGRGFFSFYVEKGLRGAAGYTGQVTVNSLKVYLDEKVPSRVWEQEKKKQTPYTTGERDLVLVQKSRIDLTLEAAAASEPRTVSGVVTDAGGNVLPDTTVRIEIVNRETETPLSFGPSAPDDEFQERARVATTVSDGRGFYKVFNVVPDAVYRVQAARAGFERAINFSSEAGKETPLVLPRVAGSGAAQAQELALVSERQFLFEDFRAAATTAREALAIEPAHTLATAVLANAIATRAENDRRLTLDEKRTALAEARVLIDRAIERNPKLALAYNGRGLIHYANGSYGQAQQDFTRAADLDRSLAVAQANLGETLRKRNRPEEARRALERAITLRPESSIPYNGLASAHLTLRNWRLAVDNARHAIARHPVEDQDLGLFHLSLALGLHEQKKCAEATQAVARARMLGADDPKVAGRIATCR